MAVYPGEVLELREMQEWLERTVSRRLAVVYEWHELEQGRNWAEFFLEGLLARGRGG